MEGEEVVPLHRVVIHALQDLNERGRVSKERRREGRKRGERGGEEMRGDERGRRGGRKG